MPLTQTEMDEADDLFVSLTFGGTEEKERAKEALERWAGTNLDRLDYIQKHDVANRLVDVHVGALRHHYPRHLSSFPSRTSSLAEPPTTPERRSSPRAKWLSVAYTSVGLVATAMAVAVYVNPVLSSQGMHSDVGEQVNVQLDDGSHVLLNTGSVAVFENRLRSREFILSKGEALFSVVHSEMRPFQVLTESASIRDIGTVFSVREDDRDVLVAVVEGKVQLSVPSNGQEVMLAANQAARVEKAHISQITGAQSVQSLLSWKERRLEFTEEPLGSLVRELQRYRKQPITFADKRAETFLVTGGFSSADPDLLLKTLPDVAPVTVRFRRDGEAVIASRR